MEKNNISKFKIFGGTEKAALIVVALLFAGNYLINQKEIANFNHSPSGYGRISSIHYRDMKVFYYERSWNEGNQQKKIHKAGPGHGHSHVHLSNNPCR